MKNLPGMISCRFELSKESDHLRIHKQKLPTLKHIKEKECKGQDLRDLRPVGYHQPYM
jgi:hypothetical protein